MQTLADAELNQVSIFFVSKSEVKVLLNECAKKEAIFLPTQLKKKEYPV